MNRSVNNRRRSAVLTLVVIALMSLVILPNRITNRFMPSAQAAGFTWTGVVSSDWFNPQNWSPNGVPGAQDTATINSTTVNLSSDTTVANLNLGGGVLTGSGILTVTGILNWTGGDMSGIGTTLIASGATLNIGGSGFKGLKESRQITNDGTIVYNTADPGDRFTWQSSAAAINNRGLFDFQVDLEGSRIFGGDNRAVTNLNNTGTLRKSAGAGAVVLACGLNNNGTAEVLSGTLRLTNLTTTSTSSGVFNVAPGATLDFAQGSLNFNTAHNLTATSSIGGAGNLAFSDGITNVSGACDITGSVNVTGTFTAVNFNSDVTVTVLNLNKRPFSFFGGVGGSGMLTISQALNWTNGGMKGNGTTLIAAGATATLSGPAPSIFERRLEENRRLTNNGTVVMANGAILHVNQNSTAVITNNGLFDVQSDVDVGSDQNQATATFNNAGIFRKSAGAGFTNVARVLRFNNSGTVEVLSGTLNFTKGITQTAGMIIANGGTLSGRTNPLSIPDQVLAINGGTLAGNGAVEFGSVFNSGNVSPGSGPGAAGTLRISGNYTQTGTGSLNIDVRSAVPGTGFDQLVTGTGSTTAVTTVDGILNLFRRGGYVPPIGESFQVARSGGSLNGQFDAVNGEAIPTGSGPAFFAVNYSGFDVNLVARTEGTIGDTFRRPHPWIDLIGPQEIRLGPPGDQGNYETGASYTLKYGNSTPGFTPGSQVGIGSGVIVPVTIFLPKGTDLESLEIDGLTHEPLVDVEMTPEERHAFDLMPRGYRTSEPQLDPTKPGFDPLGGEVAVPVLLYAAPGERKQLEIKFRAPCPPPPGGLDGNFKPADRPRVVMGDAMDFGKFSKCLGSLIEFALGFVPGAECLVLLTEIAAKLGTSIGTGENAFSGPSAIFSLVVAAAKCAASIIPVTNAIRKAIEVLDLLARADDTKDFVKDCGEAIFPSLGDRKEVIPKCVASRDPNAKYGSEGFGAERYVSGERPLNYLVTFENVADASAPAQVVTITDQLDTANFNLDTFYFETIRFGDHKITPPSASTFFIEEVDLRPASNLIVRVQAQLDASTGLATWRFSSIDPATGQLLDPSSVAGFLPPNANPPEGEGSVSFSVELKAGTPSGTAIRNRALIIFDQNEPIDTGEWLNTIDNARPTSNVADLAPVQSSSSFTVNWYGTDVDSGVQNYSVYVSENGGEFTRWLSSVTQTSAVFTGQQGKTYGFYALARDNTGNVEDAKTTAEATTTINIAPTQIIAGPATLINESCSPGNRALDPGERVTII